MCPDVRSHATDAEHGHQAKSCTQGHDQPGSPEPGSAASREGRTHQDADGAEHCGGGSNGVMACTLVERVEPVADPPGEQDQKQPESVTERAGGPR